MSQHGSIETCVAAAISSLRQEGLGAALWDLFGAMARPDNLIVMAYRDAGPPMVETLAYDVHPAPRYPRQAVRAGLEGTVTLRVLVDEQGWPRSVEIEQSSGHRELDRSAREHVLAKWRFHPAQRQGRAISAYALVPIDFRQP